MSREHLTDEQIDGLNDAIVRVQFGIMEPLHPHLRFINGSIEKIPDDEYKGSDRLPDPEDMNFVAHLESFRMGLLVSRGDMKPWLFSGRAVCFIIPRKSSRLARIVQSARRTIWQR